jgi:flagellar hook-length control protein FliK
MGFTEIGAVESSTASTVLEQYEQSEQSQTASYARPEGYGVGDVGIDGADTLTEEGKSPQIPNVSGADYINENSKAAVEMTAAMNPKNVQIQGYESSEVADAANVGLRQTTESQKSRESRESRESRASKAADVRGIDSSERQSADSADSSNAAVSSKVASSEVAGVGAVTESATVVAEVSESPKQPQMLTNPAVSEAATSEAGSQIADLGTNVVQSLNPTESVEFGVSGQVPKTVAAQVGEAIVANLSGVSEESKNAGAFGQVAGIQTQPQLVTAAQVEQALKSGQSGQTAATQSSSQVGQSTPIAQMLSQSSEFVVSLRPEHLGEVTVRLLVDGTKVSVLITAASEQVKDLLMARAGSVRVMVELTGITVDRYEVTVANTATTDSVKASYLDAREQDNRQDGQEQQESGESEQSDEEISFAEVVQAMFSQ